MKPEIVSEKLVSYRKKLWALCNRRTAKDCLICRKPITDGIWLRPLAEGGGIVRCDRICFRCGFGIKAEE